MLTFPVSAIGWTASMTQRAAVSQRRINEFLLHDSLTKNKNNKFNLIAYSGGASIALMLGANREDIHSIRTIAGNLDHNELSKITKTSAIESIISVADCTKRFAKLSFVRK